MSETGDGLAVSVRRVSALNAESLPPRLRSQEHGSLPAALRPSLLQGNTGKADLTTGSHAGPRLARMPVEPEGSLRRAQHFPLYEQGKSQTRSGNEIKGTGMLRGQTGIGARPRRRACAADPSRAGCPAWRRTAASGHEVGGRPGSPL